MKTVTKVLQKKLQSGIHEIIQIILNGSKLGWGNMKDYALYGLPDLATYKGERQREKELLSN